MIASRAEALLGCALAAALCAGCRTPAGLPPQSAFLSPASAAALPPDVADRTAVELARAALLTDGDAASRALRRLEAIDRVLDASEARRTGLVPLSHDLRNSARDRRSYRSATEELLDRDDLSPLLRKRLELFRDDGPLRLAGERIQDARLLEFARAFNAVAQPLGTSMLSAELAPYRLGRSLLNYAVTVYTRETLPLRRRQALAHWKEFLARHPDAPEAEELWPRVQAAEARWRRTQRDRALRVAREALDHDKVRLALVYADRALRHVPEDEAAAALREHAGARLEVLRAAQRRSQGAAADPGLETAPGAQRALALALLLPAGDVAGAARALEQADPEGPLADEARFALSLAEPDPRAAWKQLEALARRDPERSNMARHAAAAVSDPEQNTGGAFRAARSADRWTRARWVLLGPFYRGVRDRGLPEALEWVLDAPSIAESLAGAPARLLGTPFTGSMPTTPRVAAAARRHLARHPDAPDAESARGWLERYERGRKNWIAALRLAETRPDADAEELDALREKAADQYLAAALREPSLALRMGMYGRLASLYPETPAVHRAAALAREEAETGTWQRIQMSAGFLRDNREVAGPRGLALRPELLDERPENGELHEDGVALLGGTLVGVRYLAASGDPDDPSREQRETIGPEQLARVVSMLEEISYRNMLLDPLDEVTPDARRDLYFERARLGLATTRDPRLASISSYRYRSVRERYGMVRYHEPILPFDLVLQGSYDTLTLGAFPRLREPRETPDAILFR